MKSLLSLSIALLFISSCATIFTGSTQTVQIETIPSNAKIQIDGIDRGRTPSELVLKKDHQGPRIVLSKEGYQQRTFRPEVTFNSVSLLNTVFVLFYGIDAISGALWKYSPRQYEIELEPDLDEK